jgi:hypothetical protein
MLAASIRTPGSVAVIDALVGRAHRSFNQAGSGGTALELASRADNHEAHAWLAQQMIQEQRAVLQRYEGSSEVLRGLSHAAIVTLKMNVSRTLAYIEAELLELRATKAAEV